MMTWQADYMRRFYNRELFPFMLYERLVNATDLLADLRSTLFCVLRRPRT